MMESASLWIHHTSYQFLVDLYHWIARSNLILGTLIGSALLCSGRGKRIYNVFLGISILALTCQFLRFHLWESGFAIKSIWVSLLPLSLISSVPPALFFYIRGIINSPFESFKTDDKTLLHFIPVFLFFTKDILLLILFLLKVDINYLEIINAFNIVELLLTSIAGLTYLYLTIKYIDKYKGKHNKVKKAWGKTLNILFGILWCYVLIITLLDVLVYENILDIVAYYPAWIGMSVISSTVAFIGLVKPDAIQYGIRHLTQNKPISRDVNYKKTIKKVSKILKEDKIYQNSDLSLHELASKINESPKLISESLNHGLGKGFYEYINLFRLKEAKEALKDEKKDRYTILAIAQDAGFKSKTTFNKFFKEKEGITPKQYRRERHNHV